MGADPVGQATADAVSPELALVDLALGVRERKRLTEPDDTLARLKHEIWLGRLAAVDAASTEQLTDNQRGRWRSISDRCARFHGSRRPLVLVAAGTFASALMIATLISVEIAGRASAPRILSELTVPTTASTTELDQTATPSRSDSRTRTTAAKGKRARGQASLSDSPATRRPAGRRFAWAPVPGASGYRVEFFRGDSLVYSRDTMSPQLTMPAAWTLDGRRHRLSAGVYRWNVWPVVSGVRRAEATVQAELVVR